MTGTIRVLPHGDRWRLDHDGQSVAFATRTAALEAAVVAVQHATETASEVRITVDPSPANTKQE